MENFIISLEIMGLGMAGIFAVMLLIMGLVALLAKFGGKKPEE
ncbi:MULTISPECIES: hypothetical protein [Anaerotruncus]|jgi:hypothetical protein|nr:MULTISPECIES: hypothetical protein [Anaerotruncus]MCQ4896760.1 hypothetical protein [Anaerotruncus sp. DFI.9.16]